MSSAQLQQMIEPLIVDLGLELVGIEFAASASGGLVRVYIDEPERGVGIEEGLRERLLQNFFNTADFMRNKAG